MKARQIISAKMKQQGGWLFLLGDELYFVSHKVNLNVHTCAILYTDMVSVHKDKKINTIRIELRDKTVEQFVVNRRKEWIRILNKQIKEGGIKE